MNIPGKMQRSLLQVPRPVPGCAILWHEPGWHLTVPCPKISAHRVIKHCCKGDGVGILHISLPCLQSLPDTSLRAQSVRAPNEWAQTGSTSNSDNKNQQSPSNTSIASCHEAHQSPASLSLQPKEFSFEDGTKRLIFSWEHSPVYSAELADLNCRLFLKSGKAFGYLALGFIFVFQRCVLCSEILLLNPQLCSYFNIYPTQRPSCCAQFHTLSPHHFF